MFLQSALAEWLKTSDMNQLHWTANFLHKEGFYLSSISIKGLRYTHPADLYRIIISIKSYFPPHLEEEMYDRMQKAWKAKERRNRQDGKKLYAFALSPAVREELRQLSQESHMRPNEIIENLIGKSFRQANKPKKK